MDEKMFDSFLEYFSLLKGSEKGEAQLFLDHLFKAFGHKGIIEVNAKLEYPIKINKTIKFCDLIWPGKVLIEMKKRGEDLGKHFNQAKVYWDNTYADRTEYVILCNFDEFWIYNWNRQKEPMDKVKTLDIKKRWNAMAFLSSEENIKPIFGNDLIEVTELASKQLALLYGSLIKRGENEVKAQRFTLQCLVSLFAEDTQLFPRRGFFGELIEDCLKGQSTYDLFTLLFKKMNSREHDNGGRFQGVDYFNGGIFKITNPIDLNKEELLLLQSASKYDWSKVQPSIFGSIFEECISESERHKTGAHFTYESDIMRIIEPTLLKPLRMNIEKAKSLNEFKEIHNQMSQIKILDAACGSGNFLYLAYRELKHLEIDLFRIMLEKFSSLKPDMLVSKITGTQFYGIDTNYLGVELAKITLSMAKKLSWDEFTKFTQQHRFLDIREAPLPFDNLDKNIIVDDALLIDWPEADIIIGNPPYQSKNKMVEEFTANYVEKLHKLYPEISGRADYCVYWFRKAHKSLKIGGRAGLVGTNTIRQTYSRESGLDYIVNNGGTIIEAIGTMPWSGKAVVHVSIVNWVKGINFEKKKLAIQSGEKKKGPWKEYILDIIPSSLSPEIDLSNTHVLEVNKNSKTCFQGQTHGNKGYLLSNSEYLGLIKRDANNKNILFPYLNAEEYLSHVDSKPTRYIIDFPTNLSIFQVSKYTDVFNILKKRVLPVIEANVEKEKHKYAKAEKKINVREQHLSHWWNLWRRRADLIDEINKVKRYIIFSRVSKRPIYEFVSSKIHPNDALVAFIFEDDYSFGIIQSSMHWQWLKEKCSTLKGDYRYTINTVYNTFPWPQWGFINNDDNLNSDIIKIIDNISDKAKELRLIRNNIRKENNISLRDLYRLLDLKGSNELKKAHNELNELVNIAYSYNMKKKTGNNLEILYNLNQECNKREQGGLHIYGPGLPPQIKDKIKYISDDCINI